jgi:hypothetical protein
MTKTPVGNQPMDQGDMQVTNLSTVGLTYNQFKTQVQVYNNHDKGEQCLNNQVGETTRQVGFVT